MSNYRQRFRELAVELDQHSKIVLLDYREYPPLSEAEFIHIEEALGRILPESIKALYRETNGLRLSWIHVDDYYYDPEEHPPLTLPPPDAWEDMVANEKQDFDFDSNHESASISLKALQDVFQEPFELNEDLIEEEIYVFDAFSMIHGAAIAFVEPEGAQVIFGYDHYADFDPDDGYMEFEEYLEFLIESKGVKRMRTEPKLLDLLDLNDWSEKFIYSEY